MTLTRKITYSIGDTAKMTGATQKQIRNWEAKGYVPEAERVWCGDRAYRRFTLKQVDLISSIKCFRDEGYTLPAAAAKAKTASPNPVTEIRAIED